jgi:hypothetical protein
MINDQKMSDCLPLFILIHSYCSVSYYDDWFILQVIRSLLPNPSEQELVIVENVPDPLVGEQVRFCDFSYVITVDFGYVCCCVFGNYF